MLDSNQGCPTVAHSQRALPLRVAGMATPWPSPRLPVQSSSGASSKSIYKDGANPGKCGVSLSFVAATANPRVTPRFPNINLPSRQYGRVDGKPMVSFSASEFDAGAALFKYSLIAKFTLGRPPISEIRDAFKANWAIKGRATVSDIWDGRHLMVILDSEVDAVTALTSPLRKVGHAMFRLFRYSPDYDPRKESGTTTKWVRLPGLPPPLFTRSFVEAIINSFAVFLDVDERTKACSTLSFARACVELDVSQPIPDEVKITLSDGRNFWQKIKVEGNLFYCSHCKVHGHDLMKCRKKKPARAADGLAISRKQSDTWKTSNPNISTSTIKVTTQGESEPVTDESMLNNDQFGWTEVRSRKKGRSVTSPPGSRSQTNEHRCPSYAVKSVSPVQEEEVKVESSGYKGEVEARVPVATMTSNGSGDHKTNVRMGEEIQEQGEDRRIEGKNSKVVKESKTKRRTKKSHLESLKKGCIEVLNDTEVDSPTTTPVKVVPKPIEDALNSSLRKEFEAFLKFARSVGVKTRVPGEVAMQILLSNLREKQGNDVVGSKGDCNQWRNSSIFVKRGDRGES